MAKANIHPTAVVHPSAKLGDDAEIGPFAVIGAGVVVGSATRVEPHAVIYADVQLGSQNVVWPGAVLGAAPQDLKFRGERTRVVIGDGNQIREGVTIHRGTEEGGGVTRVGSGCLLMAYSHVAHDGCIGDNVILGNNVLLAGHIRIGDCAYICGGTAMHHFTTVGQYAYVGGLTRIVHDVPPFLIVEGNPSEMRGVNAVGLSRRGFSAETIEALRKAYKVLYVRGMVRSEAIAEVASSDYCTAEVMILLEFLRNTMEGKHGRAQEATRSH